MMPRHAMTELLKTSVTMHCFIKDYQKRFHNYIIEPLVKFNTVLNTNLELVQPIKAATTLHLCKALAKVRVMPQTGGDLFVMP
jgi:hypothetical protein